MDLYIKRLYLRNFRSYAQAEFVFGPGVNFIHGDNAQGKTSLLEAVYVVSTGRSFRTLHLRDLIRSGESFFHLETEFVRNGIEQTIKVSFDGKQRSIEHNETPYTTFTPLLGTLPCVLYAPEDIHMIAGAPAERRRFLDLHIAQEDPLYIHHLGRYFKAMKQRNQLLREQSERGIEVWEQMMAEAAGYLIQTRSRIVQELLPSLQEHLHTLSQGLETVEVRYKSTLGRESNHFLETFASHRQKEMVLGSTLSGPHRDDIEFFIGQKEACTFASEGQKWCLLAALRFAQRAHIEQRTRIKTLLGIDDFGSHLDMHRTRLLQQLFSRLGQIFVTSPKPPEAFEGLTPPHLLHINAPLQSSHKFLPGHPIL